MPKINQQKTNKLLELQAHSVESLFGGTQKNTAAHIKKILSEHLGNKNNAKYPETLAILRYARNNKSIASKLFTENMIKAIEERSELGMSQETINDIIGIIYDKKCNYYNTEEKIKALGKITISPSERSNKINGKKWMESGIGGECLMISTYAYNNFIKRKLIPRIQKETGKDVILGQYGGSTHEYFIGENDHQFLYLDIGNNRYVLDPSLGVIANNKDTSYEDDSAGTDTIDNNKLAGYADKLMQNVGVGKISLNKNTDTISCVFDGIPLGFLSDTDIFLGLGFAKTDYGKIVPMIAGTTKDANYAVYFIKDNEVRYLRRNKNNPFRHREKHIPEYVHKKIQSILSGLMKYSENIEIDEEQKETGNIQSGKIFFFNPTKGIGTVKPDNPTKEIITIKSPNKHLKDGETVKYIEANGEAIFVK